MCENCYQTEMKNHIFFLIDIEKIEFEQSKHPFIIFKSNS